MPLAALPTPVMISLDDHGLLAQVEGWLRRRGFAPVRLGSDCSGPPPELVILSADDPGCLATLPLLRAAYPRATVVLLPAGMPSLEAIGARLRDWLPSNQPRANSAPSPLLGDSPVMRELRREIGNIARSNCNVLITGETGSGKELAARLIHETGQRQHAAFVSLNCAALPEALVESELFGYEKGAFTGAAAAYPGKLKMADGGTVFLDEVGDVSLFAQAKLLRAIEDRSVFRLGGLRPVPVDFRLISATNHDLQQAARGGLFRLDLYYRLKVAHVELPPLRARRDDIPLLVRHYGRMLAAAADAAPPEFSPESLDRLCGYDWPGNVRELRNVVEAALVRAAGANRIELRDLPPELRAAAPPLPPATRAADERERIRVALQEARGNKSAAAGRLRWSRMTLYRKLALYKLPD